MILVLIFATVSLVALPIAVSSRYKKGHRAELDYANQACAILVLGGLLMWGFLALWSTAMSKGGNWWLFFFAYLIVGVLFAFKAKRNLGSLLRASKALNDSSAPNHVPDPTPSSGTPPAGQEPRPR